MRLPLASTPAARERHPFLRRARWAHARAGLWVWCLLYLLAWQALGRWLVDEVADKKPKDLPAGFDPAAFKPVSTTSDTPRQTNSYDCGMFSIMCADFLSEGLRLEFSQRDMPHFRLRAANAIIEKRIEPEDDAEPQSSLIVSFEIARLFSDAEAEQILQAIESMSRSKTPPRRSPLEEDSDDSDDSDDNAGECGNDSADDGEPSPLDVSDDPSPGFDDAPPPFMETFYKASCTVC